MLQSNQLKKWVTRLQAGDQSAFLPFYEKVAPGLLRFLLWKTRGDRPLAEDILQDAFVRFLVNIDKIELIQEVAIQSYLLQIVKNCWVDKVSRGAGSQAIHVDLDNAMQLNDPKESARQERMVELRELSVAMSCLNERDSEIVWLRDAMGFSHKEVADQVGISEQASRQAYVRAKRTLFDRLKDVFRPDSLEAEVYA